VQQRVFDTIIINQTHHKLIQQTYSTGPHTCSTVVAPSCCRCLVVTAVSLLHYCYVLHYCCIVVLLLSHRCYTPVTLLVYTQSGLARAGDARAVVTLLLHCCYTVVTLLLHCCYTVVTLLSHCCYTVVTLLSHCCHTVVTLLLHCYYTVVTLMLGLCWVRGRVPSLI
jgi:hypothetical protein